MRGGGSEGRERERKEADGRGGVVRSWEEHGAVERGNDGEGEGEGREFRRRTKGGGGARLGEGMWREGQR